MDYEQLTTAAEKAGQQALENEKYEERQQHKLEQQNIRRMDRLAPHRELNERNKAVFSRAFAIAGTLPPAIKPGSLPTVTDDTTEYSAPILLGPAKVTPATPDHVIVAKVYTSQWKFNNKPREHAVFSFLAVERGVAERLQKEPENRSISLGSNYIELAEEFTYTDGVNSEILGLGSENISGRKFSPINAIRRASDVRRISERLDKLEVSMDIIETAAHDDELNPVISHLIRSATSMPRAAES